MACYIYIYIYKNIAVRHIFFLSRYEQYIYIVRVLKLLINCLKIPDLCFGSVSGNVIYRDICI